MSISPNSTSALTLDGAAAAADTTGEVKVAGDVNNPRKPASQSGGQSGEQSGGLQHRYTRVRLRAVQAAYQMSLSAAPAWEIVAQRKRESASKGTLREAEMFSALLHTCEQYHKQDGELLDTFLVQSQWRMSRLDEVLQAILRIATAEIMLSLGGREVSGEGTAGASGGASGAVPSRAGLSASAAVIISEYMHIADAFFDEGVSSGEDNTAGDNNGKHATGLVNAVLQAVVAAAAPSTHSRANPRSGDDAHHHNKHSTTTPTGS